MPLFARLCASPFSCKHCHYGAASCCCPQHRPKTVTKFKSTISRTITRTKTTIVMKHQKRAENRLSEEVAASDGSAEALFVEEVSSHALFARHACPACPASASVLKTSGAGGQVIYCCPPRKTVTQTKGTTTKMVTITSTFSVRASVVARAFYDVDMNGIYTNPPDSPIANTVMYTSCTCSPSLQPQREEQSQFLWLRLSATFRVSPPFFCPTSCPTPIFPW